MTADCCGAPLDRGAGGAHEAFCSECGEECCSACAPIFEAEGGYGDDGQGVRTRAVCRDCVGEHARLEEPDPDRVAAERAEADRLDRETLDREPHRRGWE